MEIRIECTSIYGAELTLMEHVMSGMKLRLHTLVGMNRKGGSVHGKTM